MRRLSPSFSLAARGSRVSAAASDLRAAPCSPGLRYEGTCAGIGIQPAPRFEHQAQVLKMFEHRAASDLVDIGRPRLFGDRTIAPSASQPPAVPNFNAAHVPYGMRYASGTCLVAHLCFDPPAAPVAFVTADGEEVVDDEPSIWPIEKLHSVCAEQTPWGIPHGSRRFTWRDTWHNVAEYSGTLQALAEVEAAVAASKLAPTGRARFVCVKQNLLMTPPDATMAELVKRVKKVLWPALNKFDRATTPEETAAALRTVSEIAAATLLSRATILMKLHPLPPCGDVGDLADAEALGGKAAEEAIVELDEAVEQLSYLSGGTLEVLSAKQPEFVDWSFFFN